MPGEAVLIIEDDTTLLRGLKDNFELRGYDVRSAGDGETGLEAALSGKPTRSRASSSSSTPRAGGG